MAERIPYCGSADKSNAALQESPRLPGHGSGREVSESGRGRAVRLLPLGTRQVRPPPSHHFRYLPPLTLISPRVLSVNELCGPLRRGTELQIHML